MTRGHRAHAVNLTDEQREIGAAKLAQHVTKGDDCWGWDGPTSETGPQARGVVSIRGWHINAPRLTYALYVGPIPAGMCVCHSCDNPPCTRPDHLFLGTVGDNNEDMFRKRRNVPPPGVSGFLPWRSVATDEQIVELRELYRASELTIREVGAEFGVSEFAAQQWLKGKGRAAGLEPIAIDPTRHLRRAS